VLDSLNPDLTHLARLSSGVVYAFAQEGLHCFARSFAPAAGINEDPATGSAAGPLAAHLVLHGRLESEQTLSVHQGQAMLRPSLLLATAKVAEGGQVAQVTVGGAAVVVGRGELLL
jgi:trans-2,3-dihydro-3-hydroxyanthranilate isomerase